MPTVREMIHQDNWWPRREDGLPDLAPGWFGWFAGAGEIPFLTDAGPVPCAAYIILPHSFTSHLQVKKMLFLELGAERGLLPEGVSLEELMTEEGVRRAIARQKGGQHA
jgi:hypothetical protein